MEAKTGRFSQISIEAFSPIDKGGKQSPMTRVVHPDGKVTRQTYYANADEVLKRLRHNIAHQYWWDKFRGRLAATA